jgi:hypothetical protein
MPTAMPPWAARLISLYESQAANQFILYGNVNDQFNLPLADQAAVGSIYDFLRRVMMPRFDIVLSYDLGNGMRVEKGAEIFSKWAGYKELGGELPRAPRQAAEFLTRYFRFCANLTTLGQECYQVGFYMKAAHLVIPAMPGALNYDLNALALLVRDWASDEQLARHTLVTFLIADNIHDMHPLIASNPRTASIEIPLPTSDEIKATLHQIASTYPTAVAAFDGQLDNLAEELTGTTLSSVENLLRIKNHEKQQISPADLVAMKKELIEADAGGLIEFIESKRTLDDVYAQDHLKTWLRQDVALWRKNDLEALPMGYLICGPVGTGKTYLVECLAGEAGVPVVKLKNFRDKWVGSTEGNLEKIFRLLEGLGRCFVFIDEADQALGKRDSGANDSGLSGRIYSMFAEQMSNTANRGRIVWILASSRPDLIEVDLKRPGRVDVKIPIFPTTTPSEGFALIRALTKRRGVIVAQEEFKTLEPIIPNLLTPGAAEALAVKVYRDVRLNNVSAIEALQRSLKTYQNPVPLDVLQAQIAIAARESSDGEFVPEVFRALRN